MGNTSEPPWGISWTLTEDPPAASSGTCTSAERTRAVTQSYPNRSVHTIVTCSSLVHNPCELDRTSRKGFCHGKAGAEVKNSISDSDLASLVGALEQDIKVGEVALPGEYFYSSLPLCVIDAVFSINARYQAVQNVVNRYCSYYGLMCYREDKRGTPARTKQHSIGELIRNIENLGPEPFAEDVFRNRQRTSTRSGILKSEAVLRFGKVLFAHGVEFLQDVVHSIDDQEMHGEIRQIPGQRSGISLQYFFMLAGSDDLIKPDRMISRYLERVIGRKLAAAEAQESISRAVHALRVRHPDLTVRLLDYQIWNFQRNQRPRLPEPQR